MDIAAKITSRSNDTVKLCAALAASAVGRQALASPRPASPASVIRHCRKILS